MPRKVFYIRVMLLLRSRSLALCVLFAITSAVSVQSGEFAWGPAANAQTETSRKTKTTKRTAKRFTKRTGKPVAKPKADDDEYQLDDETPATSPQTETVVTEERDPVRIGSNARELAIRSVGVGKISVLPSARQYIPKETENRLAERLVQELAAKTYFEPQAVDGAFDLRTSSGAIAAANRKAGTDGMLVFQIGVEKIQGYLASASGRRIRSFDFKYLVGEFEEKNIVSILTDRIVEGIVIAIPYRGFVTESEPNGTATVNLGMTHGVKEGDVLELFEFRRPDFLSTHRKLIEVEVTKVLGPASSKVKLRDGESRNTRIEPFSKVSFSLAKTNVVSATDHSVVAGKWWFEFGGELNSFSAEAAAPKYESRVFRINGAPFGFAAGGNDSLSFRAAFGSGRSEFETLSFFDLQSTYTIYQLGGAQSAWTLGAGGRVFMINVTPNPGIASALESTLLVSPMAELKYQYVPRGRIRLNGLLEVFWPIYTTGAQVGALLFAFGGGAGGGLQIAITDKFGIEIFGKLRYLRRPIEGQNGVQERQSVLGAGLLFSF